MELKYKGREISIQVIKDSGGQWDWSYGIRGHGHRHNTGALAPTESVAIDNAYASAKREIDQATSGDAND
ncbi:hypothetical protein ASL20_02715 [Cupriavidus necator]|uniref:hypothetical protein n=1 Tax=Cupriavidus necator TaxID=106590 RepID=UPI0007353A64|nr:hypothetical protein [Cupriavidus necator]KUE90418.1 hypothetical protein ASL20_02715 [Cupriavidus necator]